jgi:hypothetical protein
VISHYIKGRSLTPLEQDYARQLAENNIDLNSVYSYTRAVGEMNKEFQANLNTFNLVSMRHKIQLCSRD